jgi:long-subunit acyl-CoA synthetase (AMP-forming)
MSALDSFWQALDRHAAGHYAVPALIDDKSSVTYGELPSLVAQRSQQLMGGECHRVALALENGNDWILWDLALLNSNLVCVPIPPFFSAGQVRHLLDSAAIDSIIGTLPADVNPQDEGFSRTRLGWQRLAPATTANQTAHLPQGTCKITFTSGTTGHPKGVCLAADALMTVALSLQTACAEVTPERHLVLLPLGVLLDNIGVYAALLAGARIHLPENTGVRNNTMDIHPLMQVLHDTQPHTLVLVPQLLQGLLQAAQAGLQPPASLRFIAVGGGRIAPALLNQAARFNWPVFEGYGLSECASVVCLNRPTEHKPGTVGTALPHVQISLAEDGEVLVHGNGPLGYLGDAVPVASPWPTGDIGRLDEGFLTILGRKKNQFITAFGRNVNPEWVEAELTSQPAIAQAFLYGEALPANLALLVKRNAQVTDAQIEETIARVNAGLPGYAQVHHWLVIQHPFTAVNGLLTSNGRLRRDAISQHYRQALQGLTPEELNA